MTLTASSVMLEVRTVPTCSEDLSENAHALLTHLTRTRTRNVARRVKGDQATWATALGLTQVSVGHAFDELREHATEFVCQDPHREHGYVLALLCECPAARKTESSRNGQEATSHKSCGETSSTGSASMILPASRVNDNLVPQQESPGQTAETFFLNGASADDEVAPARQENAATLTSHFVGKVVASASRQGIRVMPGSIKQGALGAHFKTILAGGIEPETVAAMIDSFAANYPRYHKPGADPGVVFLAHRRRLFAEAEKRATLAAERDITRLTNGRKFESVRDFLGRQA